MALMKKDEGPEFFRDGITYREWGYTFARLGKYPIAEIYFDKAIKAGLDKDLRTYLGLCKTQVNYARYKRATKTTEICVSIDPKYSKVKELQLMTLFQVGEFEYSLIHAHEGFRKHQTTALVHAIIQGNETIDDCVGRNTSPKALLLLSPWIQNLEEHRKLMVEKLKEEVDEFEGIDEDQARLKVNNPEAQADAKFRKLQAIIAKIYLGYLANDKEFLQMLSDNSSNFLSSCQKTTEELHALATRNFWRVLRKQNILRMRRPIYVLLFQRMTISKGYRKILEIDMKLRKNLIIVQAHSFLCKLHVLRMRKDYVTFFSTVDRVKSKFDSHSLKMFPLKQKCLDAVYNMIAWTYIDTRDLRHIRNKELKKTYLKHHMGIRVADLPRDNDIGWIHLSHRKDAFRIFRRRLAMASEPLELAWLFHELCKHLIDIRRYDMARYYGKKAREMAEEAGSEQWVLNAHHLFLRIEINQNYRNEAKLCALLALTSAKKLGLQFLVDFYTCTMNTIDEMDMEKVLSFDAIAMRQQLILDLMPPDMKPKVDYLLRSMEAVPAKRRMSVMPGCKPVDKKFKLPCKRMTILPSPPKDIELEAKRALLKQYMMTSERPGYMDFNEYD